MRLCIPHALSTHAPCMQSHHVNSYMLKMHHGTSYVSPRIHGGLAGACIMSWDEHCMLGKESMLYISFGSVWPYICIGIGSVWPRE